MASRPAVRRSSEANPPRRAAHPRARILRAATREFAAHGFAGARIARIARRARINRAMLYYYVGPKDELFREAVRGAGDRALRTAGWSTGRPVTSLATWCRLTDGAQTYLRLLQWATLEGRALDASILEPARAALTSLARLFGSHADAHHKAWLVFCCSALPIAWPQLTEPLVGSSPTEPGFSTAHQRLISVIVTALSACGQRDQPPSKRAEGL
jgi:TetR/AcrR family transcriptional regulator